MSAPSHVRPSCPPLPMLERGPHLTVCVALTSWLRPGWLSSGSGAWVFCLRGALHCMTIKKYITGVCMIYGLLISAPSASLCSSGDRGPHLTGCVALTSWPRPGWLTSGSGAWVFCLRGALHCMTIKKYITGVCMIIYGLLTASSSVAYVYERQVVGMTGVACQTGRRARRAGSGKCACAGMKPLHPALLARCM